MAVKSKLKKKNYKYEIEVPRNVEHAYALDKANGDLDSILVILLLQSGFDCHTNLLSLSS